MTTLRAPARAMGATGELALLAVIEQIAGGAHGAVRVGIGDDAAVLRSPRARDLLLTSDAFCEGVHFDLSWAPLDGVGRRAMAAALSDIAAMGGRGIAAVVSLGLPEGMRGAAVARIYQGIVPLARRHGVQIIGGDLIRSPCALFLDIAVLGEAPRGRAVRRDGGRPGDLLWVTGSLGGNQAALDLVRRRRLPRGIRRPALLRRYFDHDPLLPEGAYLARHGVRAMIDLSDGLSTDLGHLCRLSGAGARVEAARIPVHPLARRAAEVLGGDPLVYALHGGEDHELLCSAPPGALEGRAPAFRRRFGRPLTQIGRIVEGRRVSLRTSEGEKRLPPRGFDHFRDRSGHFRDHSRERG